MVITDLLERNAKLYPDEVALVEINPANQPDAAMSWREFSLIESTPGERYRRQITWREFDIKANRFANLLLTRGVKKGDKVAQLVIAPVTQPTIEETDCIDETDRGTGGFGSTGS